MAKFVITVTVDKSVNPRGYDYVDSWDGNETIFTVTDSKYAELFPSRGLARARMKQYIKATKETRIFTVQEV